MSAPTLLNINVDQLFEEHAVPEIDIIQKRLQAEVEKKREELRTMVGERYRDLLKAADTIATMKETSRAVIDEIENITANCRSLNEQQLIGFKTTETTPDVGVKLNSAKTPQLNMYFGAVSQIKLLTELPEAIWTRIDAEQLFAATQLFVFARHISTSLQIDVSERLMKHFPVAKKQWALLGPFFVTIKQKAMSVLEHEKLTPAAATDCLLSLILLERSSLDDVLKTFIQLRYKAFLSTLSSDQVEHKRVKERIIGSLHILYSTVELVCECLLDSGSGSGKGLLAEQLQKSAESESLPTLSLLRAEDVDLSSTLPDIIKNFRPSFEITELSPGAVKKAMTDWLSSISDASQNQLKDLFNLVCSMRILQEVKKEALAIKKLPNWSKMCDFLGLPAGLDFYHYGYQSLLNERIRNIIRQSWTEVVDMMQKNIIQLLQVDESLGRNDDAIQLWNENTEDLPPSLKEALSQDKKGNRLLMRAKGINAEVVALCTAFDEGLKVIFDEVSLLLDEADGSVEEKQQLLDFLRSVSQEQISEMVGKIKHDVSGLSREKSIILARLYTSLVELCPNMRLCLSHTFSISSWKDIGIDKKTTEKWKKICHLLDNESFTLWRQFCDLFLADETIANSIPKTGVTLETNLSDFVVWESTTIEEKEDQENTVQTTIRVPSQPRISLQVHLFEIVRQLNRCVPQTLPRKVLRYLTSKIVQNILNAYAESLKCEFITSNQNIALQLYFDLRFVQLLFIDHDEKSLQDECNRLMLALKKHVDPFDFDLFQNYIIVNVKKCAHRIQHQLGLLIPNPESVAILIDPNKLLSIPGSSASQQDRDPNVLCLSTAGSSTTWFPLLPIITPTSKSNLAAIDSEKTTGSSLKGKKSDTKSQMTQQTAQSIKSGAAAFFGAMSQEWFR